MHLMANIYSKFFLLIKSLEIVVEESRSYIIPGAKKNEKNIVYVT